jgi:hypothetical protein
LTDDVGNLKLDESCISNPKSEIAEWTLLARNSVPQVQSAISDFGFEMQDSSNFKIPPTSSVKYVVALYL